MSLLAFVTVFVSTLFGVSSIAKLAQPLPFRRTIADLGVPPKAAALGAWGVPVTELLTAGLLLYDPTRTWGAAVALCLGCLFGWANWRALTLRREIACNCFGSLIPDQFGPLSSARAALVAVAALLLMLGGGQTALERMPVADWLFGLLASVGLLLVYGMATSMRRVMKQQSSQ